MLSFRKMFILPKPTPEGYRVFMAIHTDIKKYNSVRYMAKIALMIELSMLMYPTCKGGNSVVSCSPDDTAMISKINLPAIMFINQYIQVSYNIKL